MVPVTVMFDGKKSCMRAYSESGRVRKLSVDKTLNIPLCYIIISLTFKGVLFMRMKNKIPLFFFKFMKHCIK